MSYAVTWSVLTAMVLLTGSVELLYAEARLDTQVIEPNLGVAGRVQGEVFKVALARTDLSVAVEGYGFSLGLRWEAGSRSRRARRRRTANRAAGAGSLCHCLKPQRTPSLPTEALLVPHQIPQLSFTRNLTPQAGLIT